MNRSQVLSLVVGLALGLAAGLFYTWGVNPVQVVDTDPSALRPEYRDQYLVLVASAFQSTHDLDRARARLSSLSLEDPVSEIEGLAQSIQEQVGSTVGARALAELALALQTGHPLTAGSATPTLASTPESTATTSATPTTAPTATISPTPGRPFQLVSQELICDPHLVDPLIQVIILDAADDPIPGIQIQVVWDTGQSRFFTGLKPELGLGYADFTMAPETTYTLQVADSESPVTDIQADACTTSSGSEYLGSWLFVFQHPIEN